MTPSEIIMGLEHNISLFKLFPADLAGGPKMIKALAGPFPNIQFCPTGGVSQANACEYFSIPSVVAVGGSWVCPASLVEEQNWQAITALAAAV